MARGRKYENQPRVVIPSAPVASESEAPITGIPNASLAQQAAASPQSAPPRAVVDLSRLAGNRAVQRTAENEAPTYAETRSWLQAQLAQTEETYYQHLAEHIYQNKTARILEWSPQEEREKTSDAFRKSYRQDLLQWLKQNVADVDERVRSFAWVMDGLDSLPHVDFALAFFTGRMRVLPLDLLQELNLRGRKKTARHFERTYKLLSGYGHGFRDELLVYFGNWQLADYQKCMALLHHDLTPAEHLYFYGVGRSSWSVQASKVIAILRDVLGSGGYAGLQRMDADWANYVHNDARWWPHPAWSNRYLYDALHESITSGVERGEMHAILNVYEKMKEVRRASSYKPTAQQDLEFELMAARFALSEARVARDDEEGRRVVRMYHQIWLRFLARPEIKQDPNARKSAEESYREQTASLSAHHIPRVAPLLRPQLTPEARIYGMYGDTAEQFVDFVTRAWLEANEDYRFLVKNPQLAREAPRLLGLDGASREVATKRVMALVSPAGTHAETGSRRLFVELNPEAEGDTVGLGRNRPDAELQTAYLFLTTRGMTAAVRNSIVQRFVEKRIPSSSRRIDELGSWESPGLTLLRRLASVFEGEEGRWFLQLQDLLDPPATRIERLERTRKKTAAGRSSIVVGAREIYDILLHKHQHPEGAVWAGATNVEAARTEGFSKTLAEEYGSPQGQQLIHLLEGIADRRIGHLHLREDEVAMLLANAFETAVYALMGVVLGPAAWAQVVVAFVSSVSGILSREALLGTAHTTLSGENAKAVGMAVVSSFLFDKLDIRQSIANRLNIETVPFLQKLKLLDKHGFDLAERTQSAMQNALAGIFDQGVTFMSSILLDYATTGDFDKQKMKVAGYQALARTLARPLHGGAGTYKTNPGSLFDSQTFGQKVNNNLYFKSMVKGTEAVAGKLGERIAMDEDFSLADAFNIAAATMANSIGSLMVKSFSSAWAQYAAARSRRPLAERWKRTASRDEYHEAIGEVVEKNWEPRKHFEQTVRGGNEVASWDAEARRQAGWWLTFQGAYRNAAFQLRGPQVAIEMERAINSAAKARYGKPREDIISRNLALLERGRETEREAGLQRRLKENPERLLNLLGEAALQKHSDEFFNDFERVSKVAPELAQPAWLWGLTRMRSDLEFLKFAAEHVEKNWNSGH